MGQSEMHSLRWFGWLSVGLLAAGACATHATEPPLPQSNADPASAEPAPAPGSASSAAWDAGAACPDGAVADGCAPGVAFAAADGGMLPSAPPRPPGTIPGGLARGSGDDADRALLGGDQALEQEDLEAARRHYERARRLAPEDPAPAVGLVRVRLAKTGLPLSPAAAPDDRRLLELQRELSAILKRSSDYGPAYLEHGQIALMLGQASDALVSLERAAQLMPYDPDAHTALGVALLATGQRAAAAARLERAVALDPHSPDRLANWGAALLSTGRVRDAIRAYEQAVALAPDDPRASGDLGTAYLAANDPYRALPHLERAVKLAPQRATFLSNLGHAYQVLGRYDQAIATCRRALVEDDQLVEAWVNLAIAYAKQRRYDDADHALGRAHALAPDDPRVRANQAELDALRRQQQAPKR